MPRRTITQEEYDAMSPEEQARFMPLEERVQQMYDAGVNARRFTPEQEARMDRMMRDLESIPDSNYNDLEAAATPLTPDPELRRPYYGRRHGMPAGMDGTPMAQGAEFASPEEAAEYAISGRDPETGARTPSPFAQDMLRAHNLAQIATPTGPQFKPGGSSPPMHIDGVINPAYLRYQEMVQGTEGDEELGIPGKAPMWRDGGTMLTPEGNSTAVLVPSKENRAQAQAYQDKLRADRQYQRDLISAMRANPEGNPADIQEAAMAARGEGAIPPSLRAQGLARSEMDRRRQNMMIGGSQYRNADNVGQIRQLLALRDRNPEAYDELLADNMGPRNFTYRFNPRTGQIEASSTRAYEPPEPPQDGRAVMAMIQQQMAAEMARREREQVSTAVRAAAHANARSDWRGVGVSRAVNRERLIAQEFPIDVIESVLDEIYGPAGAGGGAPPAPPAPATVDPSSTTVPMPGPDGAGTGMPYQHRF